MLEWQRINPGYVMNFYTDEQSLPLSTTTSRPNPPLYPKYLTPCHSRLSSTIGSATLLSGSIRWILRRRRYLPPLKSLDALLSAQPFQKVIDRTDRLLVPDHAPTAPPGLVVGIEWTGRQNNLRNALFGRKLGIVQWGFGASQGHPVLIESAKRVLENSVRSSRREWAAREGKGPEDMLPFNPAQDKTKLLVLEWSGPAVFTDCVARYLQTYYGISLSSLAHTTEPIRIGDVLLLPIACKSSSTRLCHGPTGSLGREFHPWSEQWHVMRHDHTHVYVVPRPFSDFCRPRNLWSLRTRSPTQQLRKHAIPLPHFNLRNFLLFHNTLFLDRPTLSNVMSFIDVGSSDARAGEIDRTAWDDFLGGLLEGYCIDVDGAVEDRVEHDEGAELGDDRIGSRTHVGSDAGWTPFGASAIRDRICCLPYQYGYLIERLGTDPSRHARRVIQDQSAQGPPGRTSGWGKRTRSLTSPVVFDY